MRTDPRAAEVRAIVKRVFAGFLENNEVLAGRADSLATFPRLYQPGRDTDGPIDDAQESEPSRAGRGVFDPQQTLDVDETVLIERGRYVARTYRAADLMAMWLVAVGIVQFYDDRGRMLRTINLFRMMRPERMAS